MTACTRDETLCSTCTWMSDECLRIPCTPYSTDSGENVQFIMQLFLLADERIDSIVALV